MNGSTPILIGEMGRKLQEFAMVSYLSTILSPDQYDRLLGK
jgi:hypothetical protein